MTIRDESHLTARPNICTGERLDGRLVTRGGTPVFLAADGRVFPLAESLCANCGGVRRDDECCLHCSAIGPVTATVVVQHGERPRAYDVEAT